MKNYYVKVTSYLPAPREREYRPQGSSFRSAIGKGIAKYRKEFKGKRMKKIKVIAKRL